MRRVAYRAPSASPRAGFTLVELLAALAIAAVLAAVLLPAVQGARDGARATSCEGNLRQLGQGLLLYAQDHDGRLPAAWYQGNGGFLWYFAANVTPYLGPQGLSRLKLGMCPAWNGTRSGGIPGDLVWIPNTYDAYTMGYPLVAANRYSTAPLLVQYTHPATTLLICDGAPQSGYPYAADILLPQQRTAAAFLQLSQGRYTAFRHRGRMNLIYADLHAASLKPEEVTDAMLNP